MSRLVAFCTSGCARLLDADQSKLCLGQANNEAHGEGEPAAPHQVRQLEVQVVQLQAQLRATQAQVCD